MDPRLRQGLDGAAALVWLWLAWRAWRRPRVEERKLSFWTEVAAFLLLGCWSAVKAMGIIQ